MALYIWSMSEVNGQFVKATVDTHPAYGTLRKRNVVKGPAAGKLTGCEDNFASLVWSSTGKFFL